MEECSLSLPSLSNAASDVCNKLLHVSDKSTGSPLSGLDAQWRQMSGVSGKWWVGQRLDLIRWLLHEEQLSCVWTVCGLQH